MKLVLPLACCFLFYSLCEGAVPLADDPIDTYIEASHMFKLAPCEPHSPKVLKAIYYKMAKEHHPDKTVDDPSANAFMAMINDYYNYLLDYVPLFSIAREPSETSTEPTPETTSVFTHSSPPVAAYFSVPEGGMPPTPPPPPPPVVNPEITFDAYHITHEQLIKLLNRSYYTALCHAVPSEKEAVKQRYALDLPTMATSLHAAIGVFTRHDRYPGFKNHLDLVNSLIAKHLAVVQLVENLKTICGSVSYGGVINSCFDDNILNNIALNVSP